MIRIHLTSDADVDQLRSAVREVYGGPVQAEITLDNPQLIVTALSTREELVTGLRYIKDAVPWPGHDHETLYFDIETHNAEKRWDMPREDFFRMGQYAWGIDGEVHITTDLEEMSAQIDKAYGIVAHNGHSFDFSVMLGDEALEWARDGRLFDTFIHANMVKPAPYSYRDRSGHYYKDAAAPERAKKWLSLDNMAFQLRVPGKIADLKELAKKHNPEGTKVDDLDFGLIPVDDPDFVAYGEQDVTTLQYVTRELLSIRSMEPYDWREQVIAGINSQFSRNGVLVDAELARERAEQLEKRKSELMDYLVREYDFPTKGKMPWRSTEGKRAIFKILSDNGITEATRPDWERTATGNLSLGGEVLVSITEGTKAEELGTSLAQLQGQRTLPQLALASMHSDGKVHPEISSLQRSGRFSVQRPGLTVWGAHEGRDADKEYFIAEPGYKVLEFDYSAADARAVAAMSGDKEFAKRFAPGVKPHNITGEIFFGKKAYYADKDNLYGVAKAGGHAMAYRIGATKLAKTLSDKGERNFTVSEAYRFLDNYKMAYPDVHRWQEASTRIGDKGSIRNQWGRRMIVDPERSFTQSSALLGQSFTREILCDGLIDMLHDDIRLIHWIRFTVHDAVVAVVPEEHVVYAMEKIAEHLSATHHGIDFPAEHGEPANNWKEAGH